MMATTTTSIPGRSLVWACWSPVSIPGGDPALQYFVDCMQVVDPGSAGDVVPATTTTMVLREHQVVDGNSITSIASAYGVTVDSLIASNGWADGIDHVLVPGEIVMITDRDVGEEIRIPATYAATTVPSDSDGVTSKLEQQHTVLAGESLSSIAARFGIGVDVLVNYNAWDDGVAHVILPGEIVLIPPDAIVPDPPPTVPLTTAPCHRSLRRSEPGDSPSAWNSPRHSRSPATGTRAY